MDRDLLQAETAEDFESHLELAKKRLTERLRKRGEHVRRAIALDSSRAEAFNLLGAIQEVGGDHLQAQKTTAPRLRWIRATPRAARPASLRATDASRGSHLAGDEARRRNLTGRRGRAAALRGHRLGSHLANRLSRDGHSVVAIDVDGGAFAGRRCGASSAASGSKGDATELAVLKQAKADKADAVVATTGADNVNLMVAQVAKTVSACLTWSRGVPTPGAR